MPLTPLRFDASRHSFHCRQILFRLLIERHTLMPVRAPRRPLRAALLMLRACHAHHRRCDCVFRAAFSDTLPDDGHSDFISSSQPDDITFSLPTGFAASWSHTQLMADG